MATPVLGTLTAFDPEVDSIKTYLARVELYLAANSVANAKKVPALLTALGSSTFSLLANLFTPEEPKNKSLDEIVDALTKHFKPTRSVIAERYHFHRRDQTANETIAQYTAALREAAVHCDFRDFLEQALRDRFVGGLRSETMQKRLLAETDLTLKKAVELTQAMEAANHTVCSFKGQDPAIRKLGGRFPSQGGKKQQPCYRCGKTNHSPSECRFKDAECHACGKKGHIAPACRSKAKNQDKPGSSSTRHTPKKHGTNRVYDEEPASTDDHGTEEFRLYKVQGDTSQPIKVPLRIEGKSLTMEPDIGVAVSIISEATRKSVFPQLKLRKSNVVLKTYTDESLPVTGQLNVHVQYKQQTESLVLIVVAGDGPSLFGRNWLKYIRLDLQCIRTVRKQSTNPEALFVKTNGIKHIRTAPYHPSSNGQAERFVQTFKQAMKAGEKDEPSLTTRLSQFLLTYRSTPHATMDS